MLQFTMKGDRQRRKHGLRKGATAKRRFEFSGWDNTSSPKRMRVERINESFDETKYETLGEDPGTDYTMLRPKSGKDFPEVYAEEIGLAGHTDLIILHKMKTLDFFNQCNKDHKSCNGSLEWDDDRCEQRGLAWAMALKCSVCKYSSVKEKLYDEIDDGKPGRSVAVQNRAVQLALSRQGISNTGFSDIISIISIPPPSVSGMNYNARKINPELVKINKADMKEKRDLVKKSNIAQGRNVYELEVEADGTYNNRITSGGGNNPMQPATQVCYPVIENNTPKKYIVDLITANKLSCKCNRPNGNEGHDAKCRANLDVNIPAGSESLYLETAVSNLNDDGLEVTTLTVDGDASTRKTASELQQKHVENITVQYCTRHLNNIVRKQLANTKFSNNMFHGRRVKDRQETQKMFAHDMTKRIQTEVNLILKECKNDEQAAVNKFSYLSDTLIRCYSGNHTLCDLHSKVCKSDDRYEGSKRPHLKLIGSLFKIKQVIHPTNSDDREKLTKILKLRLSPQAARATYLNRTQNKTEAVNRGLVKANPKHITHAANFAGRAHMAVLSMNNGPGTSALKALKGLKIPMSVESKCYHVMLDKDKVRKYHQARQKSATYKKSRAQSREAKYKIWEDYRKKNPRVTYRKANEPLAELGTDHTYIKNIPKRKPEKRCKNLSVNACIVLKN